MRTHTGSAGEKSGSGADDAAAGASRTRSLPREIVFAVWALVVILIMTSLALWLVANSTDDSRGQIGTESGVEQPAELLRTLATELGDDSTSADLEAAVANWLEEQDS